MPCKEKEIAILDIPIATLSRKGIDAVVKAYLARDTFHRIATVGPEFLVRARCDEQFRENLRKADMRVADGFGVTLASWFIGRHIARYAGTDLLNFILKEAMVRGLPIFLAIRKDGLSNFEEIRQALLRKYPGLEIGNAEAGYEGEEKNRSACIVLCNFGAPEQEYFLEDLRERGKHVRLGMGVGGAFDFLTGKLPHAPIFMRKCGLEWLFRLLCQPRRWRRIFRAVAIFPMILLLDRVSSFFKK